jgi:hypothetical protein
MYEVMDMTTPYGLWPSGEQHVTTDCAPWMLGVVWKRYFLQVCYLQTYIGL